MTIKEAMQLFGITSTEEISRDIIRRKHRRFMLKLHPDVGGTEKQAQDCNSARDILNKFADQLAELDQFTTKGKMSICILKLEDIIDIYNGKTVASGTFDNDGKEVLIDKTSLSNRRIILEIPVRLTFKGSITDHSYLMVHNTKDEYELDLQLNDVNINEKAPIKMQLLNKTIEAEILGSKIRFKFSLEHNILIIVQVERVEKHGSENIKGAGS